MLEQACPIYMMDVWMVKSKEQSNESTDASKRLDTCTYLILGLVFSGAGGHYRCSRLLLGGSSGTVVFTSRTYRATKVS